ncbi:hypothetical protein [Sorangium sp. So ce887]|uniref:hypothetical protein n=1 Tax=Sorangium sp. So ce887 TaxID=3133324 RepID=UPI003F5FFD00
MKHANRTCLMNIAMLALVVCVPLGCSDDSLVTGDGLEANVPDPEGEDIIDAQLEAEECMSEYSMSYNTRFLGKRGDDSFPMSGKTVIRVKLSKSIGGLIGRGDVEITKQDSEAVSVHWWLDAKTDLSYTLQVWHSC